MTDTRARRVERIVDRARAMRRDAIEMAVRAGSAGAHLGPGLSIIDITATLYFGVLRHDPNNPTWLDRDRFILSKGHGVLGYYTALAEAGYYPVDMLLNSFEKDDSPFAGHPSMNLALGIEASTGSLGHGLSIGVGMALAAKRDGKTWDTYVLVGDGECNEGMIWEAIMAANQYQLTNLIAIVDLNKIQNDGCSCAVMDMDPMRDRWAAFGWAVREVDGHDVDELLDAFQKKNRPTRAPYVVIARTIKGKGVSFFEDNNSWHHHVLGRADADRALEELGLDSQGKVNEHA